MPQKPHYTGWWKNVDWKEADRFKGDNFRRMLEIQSLQVKEHIHWYSGMGAVRKQVV